MTKGVFYISAPLGDQRVFYISAQLDDQKVFYISAPLGDQRSVLYFSTHWVPKEYFIFQDPLGDQRLFYISAPWGDQRDILYLSPTGWPNGYFIFPLPVAVCKSQVCCSIWLDFNSQQGEGWSNIKANVWSLNSLWSCAITTAGKAESVIVANWRQTSAQHHHLPAMGISEEIQPQLVKAEQKLQFCFYQDSF